MRINFSINRPVFVPPAWMPMFHGRVAPGYAKFGGICLPLARGRPVGRAIVCHHARPFHHHIVNCNNRCAVSNLHCGRVKRAGC